MQLGSRLRTAAILLVMGLGVAAVGATQADRIASWLDAPPVPPPELVPPTTIAPAAETRRVRRRRHSLEPATATPAVAPPAVRDETAAEEAREGSSAGVLGGRVLMTAGTTDLWQLEDVAALRARLDGDGDGNEDAQEEVEPGTPPELALHAYLDDGGVRLRGTAELVGERRPHLDDGVPVAITGRVVEKGSGAPVPDADVFLTSTFYVRSLQYDHHLREVGHVQTDTDGIFRVERLNADPAHFGAGGLVYVSVRSASHAPVQPVPLAGVSPGYANRLDDLALEPESFEIEGRVVSWSDGQPVAGARVLATGAIDPVAYPKDQRDALFLGAPETVTDEQGGFVLRGLGAGDQVLSVHGGDDCIGRERVRVPDAPRVEIRTLPIRGRIAGRVLDDRGVPIPLALVQGGGNSTHSFADGSFVLENFVGDEIDIWFAHADYQRVRLRKLSDGAEDVLARLASRWPELRLEVRHRDTDAPVSQLSIAFAFADENAAPVPASPYYLDTEGVHAVRVPARVVELHVSAADLEPATVEMHGHADGDVVTLLLTPVE